MAWLHSVVYWVAMVEGYYCTALIQDLNSSVSFVAILLKTQYSHATRHALPQSTLHNVVNDHLFKASEARL